MTAPSSTLNTPAISFVIPAYNAEATIGQCLRSILAQEMLDIEILCVDDASEDHTANKIEEALQGEPRIQLFRHTQNAGAPAARNWAIQEARGDYLIFMDADDELVPGSLHKLYAKATTGNRDAVKGTMLVAEKSNALTEHRLNQKNYHELTTLEECSEISHLYQYTTYLFRRSVIIDNAVNFDASLSNFQDPEFLSRLLPHCKRIEVTLEPFYIRHIRGDSIISSDWRFENYLSLARGAAQASDNLVAAGMKCPDSLQDTYVSWWHKYEAITQQLSRNQCIEVFAEMQALSQSKRPSLARSGLTKAGAVHALSLISQARLEECYELLQRSSQINRRLPRVIVKLYDLFQLSIHNVSNRSDRSL